VTVSTPAPASAVAGLTYSLTRTNTFGCGGPVTTTLVPATQPLGTTPANVTFPLSQGTADDAGTPVYLCFQVTADTNLQQAGTNTATWEFTAVSQ
jgi:hypothetical protein